MPRLPQPGGDGGNWGTILNEFLQQIHNADGSLKDSSVSSSKLTSNAVSETALNTSGGTNGDVLTKDSSATSGLRWGTPSSGGAVTLAGDVTGPSGSTVIAAGAVTAAKLADGSVSSAKLAAGSVGSAALSKNAVSETNLNITNSPATNQVLSWNGTGLAWVAVASPVSSLDGLSDVSASGATSGQVLQFDGTTWAPATPSTSGTIGDATTSAKGIVQLAGDLGGTAAVPTVPGLANKANTSLQVATSGSLTGGGTLTTDRTLGLVGDSATPGNSKYYGTSGTGTKGFYDLPSTGSSDPTMGGDLTGTASNAQIAAGAVGASELANNAVITAKILDANVTSAKLATGAVTLAKISAAGASSGQVLAYDGADVVWQAPATGSGSGPNFTPVTVTTATYTASYDDYVFADASSTGITITLPPPQLNRVVRVQAMDNSANSVQVGAPSGSYINGLTAGSVTANIQYMGGEFWSDGNNWFTMG